MEISMFGLKRAHSPSTPETVPMVNSEAASTAPGQTEQGKSASTISGVARPDVPWRAFENADRELDFQKRKIRLHEILVEALNLRFAVASQPESAKAQYRDAITAVVARYSSDLSESDRSRMAVELLDEAHGLGPLEPLTADDSITDILVNNPHEVFVERRGCLQKTPVLFADGQHLLRIVQRLTAKVGRRVDESNPMVDARLPDGSRLNVTIPPLAIDGATISIRRFPRSPLTMDGLVERGSLSRKMAEFLQAAVVGRVSMLISGGTGTGKTTLLNALAASVPHDERIVTVEDSAELRLGHPHVVRMESRVANTEGAGSITLRDLVRNALRMRPDRLLVGEVRGDEAIDMLQAMNTGHEGSFTTIHANDAREALTRLELMIAMGGFELPLPVIRNYVASGIRMIVHLARWKGGARRIVRISEVNGVRDGDFVLNDVFRYRFSSSPPVECSDDYVSTGHIPACLARLQHAGSELIEDDFAPSI
jgi:pilus assembly protein CpaF